MRRTLLLLAVPLVLLGCGDDGGTDFTTTTAATDDRPEPDPNDGDDAALGTVAVRLEPTEGIFVEGFDVGIRIDDPVTGEVIEEGRWGELFGQGADPYTAVLEQPVPPGTVRIGADVNIGIGPGPEPPDLDAERLPCELEVEVAAGDTVEVEVAFDDSTPDCARIVD